MAAKYYTYRNLNGGSSRMYSTKYKGKVVWRGTDAVIDGPIEFRVSAAGRARVLKEGKKNVHAFIVSDSPPRKLIRPRLNLIGSRVIYNPLYSDSFHLYADNMPSIKTYKLGIMLRDSGVWLMKVK